MNSFRRFRDLFTDLDRTLLDTDRFAADAQRFLAEALDVAPEALDAARERIRQSGYTLEKHLGVLRESGAISGADARGAQQSFFERFRDLRAYVFSDTEPFLAGAVAEGLAARLLSFGENEWQRYKLVSSGLGKYFTEIICTGERPTKHEAIAARKSDGAFIFVDDDAEELDLVRERWPEARTVLIARTQQVRARTRFEEPGGAHETVSALRDIRL